MIISLFLSAGGEIPPENGTDSNSDLLELCHFHFNGKRTLLKANDMLAFYATSEQQGCAVGCLGTVYVF